MRNAIRLIPLAGLGAGLAAVLSGCGGATTNGSPLAPTPNSGPVIYGQNALALYAGSSILGETSGLGSVGAGGAVTGILTGATGYTTDAGAGPLPAYKQSFAAGIPLGFPTDGAFYNSSPGAALSTANIGSVVFRAYISTGVSNNAPADLDTNSVILTSAEAPTLSQKLTFDPNFGSGQLGQGQYTTGTFALPASFATTGLHTLTASVADVAGQRSHTNFDVVVLAPTDSGVLFPFSGGTVPAGQPANSTASVNTVSATITNAITGARTRVVMDDTNTFVLFAAPGSQTITLTANVTVTHPDKTTQTFTQTGTATDTLIAGQMLITPGISVSGSTAATAAVSTRLRSPKK